MSWWCSTYHLSGEILKIIYSIPKTKRYSGNKKQITTVYRTLELAWTNVMHVIHIKIITLVAL